MSSHGFGLRGSVGPVPADDRQEHNADCRRPQDLAKSSGRSSRIEEVSRSEDLCQPDPGRPPGEGRARGNREGLQEHLRPQPDRPDALGGQEMDLGAPAVDPIDPGCGHYH